MGKKAGGKKNRKYGRNAAFCVAYRNAHKHERSHLRRLARHLARFAGDTVAAAAVEHYKKLARPIGAAA